MRTPRLALPAVVARCLPGLLFLFVAPRTVVAQAIEAPCEDAAAERQDDQRLVRLIDDSLQRHWRKHQVTPAPVCDDATFLRRLTLDLLGRIPTSAEATSFLDDKSPQKRADAVQRLLASPEFPLNFGSVLDGMIQERDAGNADFVKYMRSSVQENKPWDQLFREMFLGPWDQDQLKAANRFLDKRARDLGRLTADTTRVFFGVDISCAKCHDHPLVSDWTQNHYYGMASFLNRTTGGKGKVGEKNDGEVTFVGAKGEEHTARMMFLSGDVVDEPAKPEKSDKKHRFSRREQLVEVALRQETFFSRAVVNRLWAYFYGRGLVHPVDQMHSENPSAVPGLLESLATDFAEHGYKLRRLARAMVSSRAYQLSSRWAGEAPLPEETLFAVARLRPLSRRQFSLSLLLACGDETFAASGDGQRAAAYKKLEGQAAEFANSLDALRVGFQSSAKEALFLSNSEVTQKLIAAGNGNLVRRLADLSDTKEIVNQAMLHTLGRTCDGEELAQLTAWFDSQGADRPAACGALVWALLTSAEFRFNH